MRVVVLVASLVVLVGCQFTASPSDQSSGEGNEMSTWDLSETTSIEAVGWPEDVQQRTFERTAGDGLERIVLPGDLTLEGFEVATAGRGGGVADRPLETELRTLGVSYPDAEVDEVRDLAVDLADRIGTDPEPFRAWATRNADGVATSPDGSRGRSPSVALGDAEVSVAIQTRAVAEGQAYLTLSVFFGEP